MIYNLLALYNEIKSYKQKIKCEVTFATDYTNIYEYLQIFHTICSLLINLTTPEV